MEINEKIVPGLTQSEVRNFFENYLADVTGGENFTIIQALRLCNCPDPVHNFNKSLDLYNEIGDVGKTQAFLVAFISRSGSGTRSLMASYARDSQVIRDLLSDIPYRAPIDRVSN